MSDRTSKDDPQYKLLADIKSLLVLTLFAQGMKPSQIAKALDVDLGAFSRAYPIREILGKSKKD